MPCNTVELEGGIRAIVCTKGSRRRCKCGARAALLCDWKVKRRGKDTTCDRPICVRCAHRPAPNKDICAEHKQLWDNHPKNPLNRKEMT